MLNLILFGPPGSGKGTQSERLIQKYNLVHLSTGDILRAEIAGNTELGQEAKKFIDKGDLVPDTIVIGMIDSHVEMNKNKKGFILDGFPRNTKQAIALDNLMEEKNLSINILIALDVEHNELVKRIQGRSLKYGRTDDQEVSIIENRIKVYHEQTSPVINYYAEKNKYKSIVGDGEIDEIFSKLCNVIDSIKSN